MASCCSRAFFFPYVVKRTSRENPLSVQPNLDVRGEMKAQEKMINDRTKQQIKKESLFH